MSAKRKLSRSARSKKPDPGPTPDKASLRHQTRSERFKRPGSERLWEALLGWDQQRLCRIWLVQAVHDAAAGTPQALGDQLPPRLEEHAASLDAERIESAVGIWKSDSDEFRPDTATPKWHVLANWIEQLGWGTITPEALQLDWEVWISLGLAGKPRMALMQLLQQTEAASVELDRLTQSDNTKAVANVTRALWFALAYGDEETFEKIKHFSSQFSLKAPGR